MSRTWFTADLHLGQRNIIGHCHRPYRSAAQMNADLVLRWNRVVGDDDTVWVLGDVGAAAALPLVRVLRGTKHLISGNHDYCWPGNGPLAGATRWMYVAAGFATIRSMAEIELGGERVALSHFPYEATVTAKTVSSPGVHATRATGSFTVTYTPHGGAAAA